MPWDVTICLKFHTKNKGVNCQMSFFLSIKFWPETLQLNSAYVPDSTHRYLKMYIDRKQRILLLIFLCMRQITSQTPTTTPPKICTSNDYCSDNKVCCGKPGYNRCRTKEKCIGVPCSSSFECDDGGMWCCSHECQDSSCLLPVWAIVLIALAVAIIISVLLIYVILECCRRWPNLRRTWC